MVRLTETRTVNKPLDETFAYLSDFTNVAEWDPGISAAAQIGEGPVGVGTRYDVKASFVGRTIPMVYEVIEYEAPNRIVLKGTTPQLDAVDTIRFSPAGDGATRVDYQADFTLKTMLRFVEPFMRPLFNRLGVKALDGLKSTVDAL